MAEPVSPAVLRLVKHHVGPYRTGEELHVLFRYCMNVLGSRISTSSVRDEVQISDSIKKKLIRRDNSSNTAVAFSNLYLKLASKSILSKKWSILYLLQALSDHADSELAEELIGTSLPFVRRTTQTPPAFEPSGQAGPTAPPATDALTQTTHHNLYYLPRTSDLKSTAPLNVAESEIMKDMVFVFQGIDGSFVRHEEGKGHFELTFQVHIPSPTRALICQLSELGGLYRCVEGCIQSMKEDAGLGLIGQSFCSALQGELDEYYRLIAVLNSHAKQQLDVGDTTGHPGRSFRFLSRESNTLSLRRLMVWTFEPVQRLRMLATLCEVCHGLRGGPLLSQIRRYVAHGDPTVQAFVRQILSDSSKPFYDMVRQWIYEGEIEDPFNEFFVITRASRSDPDNERHNSASMYAGENLWRNKYSQKSDYIPIFISKSTAKKIFLSGKNLNFIRYSCGEDRFVLPHAESSTSQGFQYGDEEALELTVESAYAFTCKKLLEILFERYSLYDHLSALRRYMLLAQGDFAQALMDSLWEELSQPAASLYTHNLTCSLEGALRSSSGGREIPDILGRLDVRMIEISQNEMGWDTFTLNYMIDDAPLNTIFGQNVMIQYAKLFRFLWKLKRVEYVLGERWRDGTRAKSSEAFRTLTDLGNVFQKARLTRAEMLHFLRELLQFLTFEVIERSWQELNEYLSKRSGNLDDLCSAHIAYLNRIVTRGFLMVSADGNESLFRVVNALLDMILEFSRGQTNLYNYAHMQLSLKKPTGGSTVTLRSRQHSDFKTVDIDQISKNLEETRDAFKTSLKTLLTALSQQSDENLKDLGVRLNFNEFYRRP